MARVAQSLIQHGSDSDQIKIDLARNQYRDGYTVSLSTGEEKHGYRSCLYWANLRAEDALDELTHYVAAYLATAPTPTTMAGAFINQ